MFGFFRKSGKKKKVDRFDLIDSQSDESLLRFERTDAVINFDEWYEIPQPYSDNWKKYISASFGGGLLGAGAQAGAVAALVPNGLYTATVNPALLMTYSNATIGSAVMGMSGISAHAGFKAIAGPIFAPILIFQALSLLTGQYYMNGIRKQLTFIDDRLREIIELYHIERVAKIRVCRRIFREFSERSVINIEDMIQFRSAMTDIGIIHEEYSEQLSRIDTDAIKNVEKSFWTSDKIRELSHRVNRDNYDYKLKITVLTDELYHLGKIIELQLNSRMRDNPENRNLRIIELINEIKTWNKDKFYFNRVGDRKVDEYYREIVSTLKNIYYEACFHDEEADKLRKNYEEKYHALKSEISDPNSKNIMTLLEISKELIENLETPKEMLLSNGEEGMRLWIRK